MLDKLPGLLQGNWTDDPDKNKSIQQGLLATAFQLMGTRGNFGEGLGRAGMAGMGAFQQDMQDAAARKRAQLQQQMMEQQMAEQTRQIALQQARGKALQGAYKPGTPETPAAGFGMDPQPGQPATPGGFDWNSLAQNLAQGGDYEGALPILQSLKKDTTPIKVGADDTLLDPATHKPLWQGAGKPKDAPNTVQEYEYARIQGYRGTYEQWKKEMAAAGRPEGAQIHMPMQAPTAGYATNPDGSYRRDASGQLIPVFMQTPARAGGQPTVVPGIAPPALVEDVRELQMKDKAATDKMTEMLGVIEMARTHPGKAAGTGVQGWLDPRNYLPGTEAKNFGVVLDQLKGQAFLQAYESLKGAGAVTEQEGKKAGEAIARLNAAQTTEAFNAALNDLHDITARAYQRKTGKAWTGGTRQSGTVGPPGQQPPGDTRKPLSSFNRP